MKNKKLGIVALGMASVFALCACSSNGTTGTSSVVDKGSNQTSSGNTYKKVVFAFPTFNNVPTVQNQAEVEEAINQITREKIGIEVDLVPIGIADYAQQVTLSLQGGDQVDVFVSLGDFSSSVATGKAYDITDIIDTCAEETKEIIGQDWFDATSKDGRLYGIPTYKPIALTPMVVYKQDIADELGIDMTQVSSAEDMTEVLRTVKTAYPDMTPFVPVNPGESGLIHCLDEIDYLSDSYMSPTGVIVGASNTVEDFYSLPGFENLCNLVRGWYEERLILQDAATTTATSMELMSGNNSFCYIAAYSYPEEDTAASLSVQSGTKLGAKIIGDAYLDTTAVNALTWMVASTSKVPEEALKFLNLTFSDEEVVNLIINGIEGRDYTKYDDGTIGYPEGLDAASVPYTAALSCGVLGNFFIMYPTVGTTLESLEWELEQNKNAKTSSAMGFVFDPSKVKTEYTVVSNIIKEYLPGLMCGSVDPQKELPKYVQSLKSSGLDKIIEAKQEQLNEWVATNGK